MNFNILAGRCRELLILQLPKTSVICKFPCLLNLTPTNLPLSLIFLCLPCTGTSVRLYIVSYWGCKVTEFAEQLYIYWWISILYSHSWYLLWMSVSYIWISSRLMQLLMGRLTKSSINQVGGQMVAQCTMWLSIFSHFSRIIYKLWVM